MTSLSLHSVYYIYYFVYLYSKFKYFYTLYALYIIKYALCIKIFIFIYLKSLKKDFVIEKYILYIRIYIGNIE